MYTNEFLSYQENKFDSFCRVVIKNASSDNLRSKKRREALFLPLDALRDNYDGTETTEDSYITYLKTYRVKGIDIRIVDEQIGEALQYILPNQRAVLLLSYFREYKDSEIARLLGISHKTVAYRKQLALKKLKMLLEGMQDASKN